MKRLWSLITCCGLVGLIGCGDVPATGPAGAAVQHKPIIDADQPSLEKILGANADMVIGYGPGKTTAENLAGVKIPIYVQTAYCGPPAELAARVGGSYVRLVDAQEGTR